MEDITFSKSEIFMATTFFIFTFGSVFHVAYLYW